MVKSLKDLRNIDIEKMAKAIEVDAGMPLPELRQALEEACQVGYIELDEALLNFPGPDPDSSRSPPTTGKQGSDMPDMDTITFELLPDQAEALAQFVKRVGWAEMRACAVDDNEVYEIRAALAALAKGLAEAGHAPR